MFRRFNFSSILAWTAGRIASNGVSYRTRKKQRFVIEPAGCPEPVTRILEKIQTVESEFNILFKNLGSPRMPNGAFNLTPMLQLFVYGEWVQKHRNLINRGIHNAYAESISEGYLWKPGTCEEVQRQWQALADDVRSRTAEVQSIFDSMIKNAPTEQRENLFRLMEQRKRTCRVEEISGKFKDSSTQRLLIQES